MRPEADEDRQAVRELNQSAFGGNDEASLVDQLRDGGLVVASLVALTKGQIVGHILFSRISILTDDVPVSAVSLAPMAVLPGHQRMGIGSDLVEAGLRACTEQGDKIVIVLGHPGFYPRFGFSAELAQPLVSPFGGGEAWMALELEPGALAGVAGRVEYSPPFGAFE
ncbi:MAG: N-acetyltransferase [Fuerstiella sp.]|nr:N-acetyltransferase [Fuerstiella sp.]MCP4857729.1 N-acetyltransferase [Fuerstiella sp.]